MIKEKDKYRLLIENLPDGFAYCKMVLDSSGKPLDYIFLEVNSSFETLTGFPRENVIGKKLTEVYPGIKSLDFDWIDVFDQVAATGKSTHLQQYFELTDRCYEITAYSDQPGYFAVVFRDITENKKDEEELRQREKNFSTLVENTPDMIVRFNLDLQHIYCNAAVEHQFGVPVHGFIGKTFLEIDGSPEQNKSNHQLLKKAFETGKEQQTEQSLPTLFGQKYFQTRIVPERNEKGRIESLLAVSRDITERKQEEEALKKSVQILNDTGEMAKVGGWELDLSTQEVSWTEEVSRIHGVEPGYKPKLEEALNFYAPESRPAVEEALKKAAETGEPYDLELLFIPSGSKDRIWVRAIGRAVYSGGKITKLAGTFQNIDKYKRVEERFSQLFSEQKLLLNNIEIMVWYLKDIEILGTINKTYADFYGITESDPENKTLWEIRSSSPEDEVKICIEGNRQVFREKKQIRIEEWVLNSRGESRQLDITKTPKLDSNGNVEYVVCSAVDITERKQIERELINSERMAIAGQLAAGVAHEFNNLLSIIGGSAEYAKGIRNENEIKKSLDVIVKSANRGAQVVKKLLTFTKRIELKQEPVDLIEVIEEVVGLANRDLENNSITVVRNYSDIPKTLIDVGQIQQVFLNLIINAKNAMSKGGELAIKVEKEGEFIKIQFHNTGKVINQEDLPRLFTPFFMTSRQQKKGMPGTGLGLAVSYGIIKAHNGVIKAESAKGKGTTFTVLLAVTKNENMAEVLPKVVAKAVKNNKRKLKQVEILIVDDEVEIGKLFKKVLDKEGYSVTFADSGGNALNWCRKKKFDLIYLDIIMPGMDGIFVFKKIKEISPKTKIVFFTGKLIEDKVAGMCLDEGAAGFLRKPIPLKDLVSYTQNILKTKNE